MAKKQPTEIQEPEPVATETEAPAAAPPVEVIASPSPVSAPEPENRLGLDLLKFEYADKKTGEPTPLNWRPHVIGGGDCGIVSKFGLLLYPDQSVAKFTHAEALEVRKYLTALRPNDEIQITNL